MVQIHPHDFQKTLFESAQQQIGDKGTHDLHGQGILAVAEGALDLEHLLGPLPPVLNGL